MIKFVQCCVVVALELL